MKKNTEQDLVENIQDISIDINSICEDLREELDENHGNGEDSEQIKKYYKSLIDKSNDFKKLINKLKKKNQPIKKFYHKEIIYNKDDFEKSLNDLREGKKHLVILNDFSNFKKEK